MSAREDTREQTARRVWRGVIDERRKYFRKESRRLQEVVVKAADLKLGGGSLENDKKEVDLAAKRLAEASAALNAAEAPDAERRATAEARRNLEAVWQRELPDQELVLAAELAAEELDAAALRELAAEQAYSRVSRARQKARGSLVAADVRLKIRQRRISKISESPMAEATKALQTYAVFAFGRPPTGSTFFEALHKEPLMKHIASFLTYRTPEQAARLFP
jgi:hypothetical protein